MQPKQTCTPLQGLPPTLTGQCRGGLGARFGSLHLASVTA